MLDSTEIYDNHDSFHDDHLDEDVRVDVSVGVAAALAGPAGDRGHVDVLDDHNGGAADAWPGLHHRHVDEGALGALHRHVLIWGGGVKQKRMTFS